MTIDTNLASALIWREVSTWREPAWQADIDDGTNCAPGDIYGDCTVYRIFQRSMSPVCDLWVWSGPAADASIPVTWEYDLKIQKRGKMINCCTSFEAAKIVAQAVHDTPPGKHWHRGEYESRDYGFVVQYHSDIDGDRWAIIDDRKFDMSGWKIKTLSESGRLDIQEFDRDDRWFNNPERGVWTCFGYSSLELGSPWTALCGHGERIIQWIPPAQDGV